MGRWLSKDPIGEIGGINLYEFLYNTPLILWDDFGLEGNILKKDIGGPPIVISKPDTRDLDTQIDIRLNNDTATPGSIYDVDITRDLGQLGEIFTGMGIDLTEGAIADLATAGMLGPLANLAQKLAKLKKSNCPGAAAAAKEVEKQIENILKSVLCFAAGTLVKTADGQCNIEDIKVGDVVLAADPLGDNKVKECTITDVLRRTADKIYVLEFSDGQEIETTAEHPFWVKGKGWTEVKCMELGDEAVTINGNNLKLIRKTIIEKTIPVFNITVDGLHCYFIGNSGILVHNACGQYMPSPKDINGLTRVKNKSNRTRWMDKKGRIYEWDSQHGELEMYNSNGKHIGVVDPKDPSKIIKPAVPGRTTPK